MNSSLPPSLTRWPHTHPLAFSAGMFVLMGLIGLAIFWDYRGALAGAVCSAGLSYLWVRPGGIGYRIEVHQQRMRGERDDMGVRPAWLIKAALWVVIAFAMAAAIIYTVDRAT